MNNKAVKVGKEETSIELPDCDDFCQLTTRGKMRALLQKNFLRMWRNVGWVLSMNTGFMKHTFYGCGTSTMILYHCHRVMLFIFALPVMQVILFCLAIGRDPIGLHLAVVNHELNQSGGICEYNDGCSFKMLSCRYLQHLDNVTIIKVSVSSYRVPSRKWECCRHLGIKSCKNMPANVTIFACSCVWFWKLVCHIERRT